MRSDVANTLLSFSLTRTWNHCEVVPCVDCMSAPVSPLTEPRFVEATHVFGASQVGGGGGGGGGGPPESAPASSPVPASSSIGGGAGGGAGGWSLTLGESTPESSSGAAARSLTP